MQFLPAWYLLAVLLGWLTFPLAYQLFPALAHRGDTLTRTFGLLIWGYVFWMLASLGIAQNDAGGLLMGIIVLAGLSGWAVFSLQSPLLDSPILAFLRSNRRLILTTSWAGIGPFSLTAVATRCSVWPRPDK